MADRGDAQPGLDGTPALELAQFSNDQTMSASTLSIVISRQQDDPRTREQEKSPALTLFCLGTEIGNYLREATDEALRGSPVIRGILAA